MDKNILIKGFLADFEKQHKRSKKKRKCIISGCKTKAISSHSQQRRGPLTAIQEKKHVYCLHDNLCNTFNIDTGKLHFDFKSTPISKASTFPGFCSAHDNSLFGNIENQNLDNLTYEQARSLLYRSLSYEQYRKSREIERWAYLIERIEASSTYFNTSNLEKKLEIDKYYLDKNLLRDMNEVYKLGENSSKNLQFKAHIVNKNLGVSCSGMFNMHLDRYLEFIEQYPENSIPSFSFNAIPTQDKTYLIFVWQNKYDSYATGIKSYFEDNKNFNILINKLIFTESEDICVRPSLWESIPPFTRDQIIQLMHHPTSRGVTKHSDIPLILNIYA